MSGNTIGPGAFQPLQHAREVARAAAQADAATVDAHEAAQALDDNAGALDEMTDTGEEKNVRLRDRKAMRPATQAGAAAGMAEVPEDGLDPSILARLRAEADTVDQHELQEGMEHSGAADEWLDDEVEDADRPAGWGQEPGQVHRAGYVRSVTPSDEVRIEEMGAGLLDDLPAERREAALNYLSAQITENGPTEALNRLVPVEGPPAVEAAAEPMLVGPLDIHDEGTRQPLPPPDFPPEIEQMAYGATGSIQVPRS